MAAPITTIRSCTATSVSVVFDQTLFAPTGRPGEGFSITVNGAARALNSASQATTTLSNDTVVLTPLGTISFGDIILITYSNAANNLRNAGFENPANFTASAVTNNSTHAGMLNRVLASNVTDPNVITISFNLPVTSADFTVGATVKSNGVVVPVTAGAVGANVRQVILTLAQSLQYSDTVTLSYAPGSWTSGTAIAAFTDLPVINASKLGTPNSAYPLSTVVQDLLVANQGVVTASISLDLNLVDATLLSKYGPQIIDYGGTFGVTAGNPSGLVVVGPTKALRDGDTISQAFYVLNFPNWSADAGRDWLGSARGKVQAALTRLRTQDTATNLGTRTVVAV